MDGTLESHRELAAFIGELGNQPLLDRVDGVLAPASLSGEERHYGSTAHFRHTPRPVQRSTRGGHRR
jgi:hypothetical protein